MKTAMQELIEIIKDKRKESDISNSLLRFCQFEAEKLLEKEKEQIIYSNKKGWFALEFDFKFYENNFGNSNEAGI